MPIFGALIDEMPLLAPLLFAQGEFPRGPGFYYSFPKLIFVIIAFFVWIRLAAWVNKDAERIGLQTERWNSFMLGAGVLGFLVIWILPVFMLGIFILILSTCGALYAYIRYRDPKVPADARILTQARLNSILKNQLRMKVDTKKPTRNTSEEDVISHSNPSSDSIRFVSRGASSNSRRDRERFERVNDSKGYKAALSLVSDAIERRATDIHLEPTREETLVRYRIDGVMQSFKPLDKITGDAVTNIFKVLCELDITEKRKPQGGSFSAELEDRTIDFRVATAGSVSGEKLVMRILDQSTKMLRLKRLGMRDKLLTQIRDVITRPYGLFLVCGPTGSGKSTTLYAGLNELDRTQQNIITIEDPVEYWIDSVTQIEINAKAGKSFANELRSILRQDPDVIMIGEIRDRETAEIACQAAQTGHLVLSTVHANDTVTAIGRMLDLGVTSAQLASGLSAVLGQRLVRLLCPKCKIKYKPDPGLLAKANLPVDKIKFFYRSRNDKEIANSKPCPKCGFAGYHGRTGIYELLVVNDKIRDLMRAERPNPLAIKQEAVKSGMRYLYEDGFRQVIEGKTSIQELLRVCK